MTGLVAANLADRLAHGGANDLLTALRNLLADCVFTILIAGLVTRLVDCLAHLLVAGFGNRLTDEGFDVLHARLVARLIARLDLVSVARLGHWLHHCLLDSLIARHPAFFQDRVIHQLVCCPHPC
jgi:hypothetical protein